MNDVVIKVTESDDGTMTIAVKPFELVVGNSPEEQTLRFKLDSDNFRYVQDAQKAIEILDDLGHQFSDHVRGPEGKMIVVKDKNTDNARYHYILRIENKSGQRIELDPLIKNGESMD